jgi:hypothetical protein
MTGEKSLDSGDPGGSRTPNPQIRSLMLYPVELRGRAEICGRKAVYTYLRVLGMSYRRVQEFTYFSSAREANSVGSLPVIDNSPDAL